MRCNPSSQLDHEKFVFSRLFASNNEGALLQKCILGVLANPGTKPEAGFSTVLSRPERSDFPLAQDPSWNVVSSLSLHSYQSKLISINNSSLFGLITT
jgi:hypothetical protein